MTARDAVEGLYELVRYLEHQGVPMCGAQWNGDRDFAIQFPSAEALLSARGILDPTSVPRLIGQVDAPTMQYRVTLHFGTFRLFGPAPADMLPDREHVSCGNGAGVDGGRPDDGDGA